MKYFTLVAAMVSLFLLDSVFSDAEARRRYKKKFYKGGVVARVSLARQVMTVYVNGRRRYSWRVSTGKRGFATPRGSYGPKRFSRMHYSRKYGGAPMPHSIFFRGGYAVHATGQTRKLGRRASHGCIRLAPRHAARLYALMRRRGGRISIR